MVRQFDCPECGKTISTADADAGEIITCEGCKAEVSVPASTPVARATPVVARPVAAKPAMAKPVGSTPAKPAGSVPAKPAGKPGAKADGGFDFGSSLSTDSKKSSRRRAEDRDFDDAEEEDDDDRRPNKKKNGNKKLLLILAGVAGVCVLSCAGGVWYVYQVISDARDRLVQKTQVRPSEDPAFANGMNAGNQPMPNPFGSPSIVQMPLPAVPIGEPRSQWAKLWQASPSSASEQRSMGFRAELPVGASMRRPIMVYREKSGRHILISNGVSEISTEAAATYTASYSTLPDNLSVSVDQFIRNTQPISYTVKPGSKSVTVDGKAGEEFTISRSRVESETVRAVQVGDRIFVFSVVINTLSKNHFVQFNEAEGKEKFFKSIRITYTPPSKPVGSSPAGTPSGSPFTPVGSPPSESPSGSPFTPTDPSGKGLKFIGAIDPFYIAAVLPAKNEIITFGVSAGHNGIPGGVVKRFSLETFKLLSSVDLGLDIHAAAVHEEKGLVVMSTTRRSTGTLAAPEPGDVRIYALNDFSGMETPKPTYTIPLGSFPKPRALALAPDGSAAYLPTYLGVNARTRTVRSQVVKIDTVLGKLAEAIEVSADLFTIQISPDGKYVFAGEPEMPAPKRSGRPAPGPAPKANLHIFQTTEWKKLYDVKIPVGGIADIRFFSDDAAVLTCLAGRDTRFYIANAAGEVRDVSITGRLHFEGSFWTAILAEGKAVMLVGDTHGLVFGGARSGLEIFAFDSENRRLIPQTWSVGRPGRLVGGPVFLSPDHKIACFMTGDIFDVSGVDAGPAKKK